MKHCSFTPKHQSASGNSGLQITIPRTTCQSELIFSGNEGCGHIFLVFPGLLQARNEVLMRLSSVRQPPDESLNDGLGVDYASSLALSSQSPFWRSGRTQTLTISLRLKVERTKFMFGPFPCPFPCSQMYSSSPLRFDLTID